MRERTRPLTPAFVPEAEHGAEVEDGTVSSESDDCSRRGWVAWYSSLYGHEVFVEVDDEFIRDGFNLFGLKPKFSRYEEALAMILGPALDEDELARKEMKEIYKQATDLYGLIHARFITTPKGLVPMRQKYIGALFGRCPRVLCDRQPVLPVGVTEELHEHRFRVYCPKCQETYNPKLCGTPPSSRRISASSNSKWDSDDEDKTASVPGFHVVDIDGACFGPSFPHSFLLQFTLLIPKCPPAYYVPRIFGFRVYGVHSLVKAKLDLVRQNGRLQKDICLQGEYGKAYKTTNGIIKKTVDTTTF